METPETTPLEVLKSTVEFYDDNLKTLSRPATYYIDEDAERVRKISEAHLVDILSVHAWTFSRKNGADFLEGILKRAQEAFEGLSEDARITLDCRICGTKHSGPMWYCQK